MLLETRVSRAMPRGDEMSMVRARTLVRGRCSPRQTWWIGKGVAPRGDKAGERGRPGWRGTTGWPWQWFGGLGCRCGSWQGPAWPGC